MNFKYTTISNFRIIFSVECTDSYACNGNPSVSGDKGYCDFSENSNGICKHCSDVNDGCTGETVNGERECKEICEGNAYEVS